MLGKLENAACFFAAMLVIVLEGACVYWLWSHVNLHPETAKSLDDFGLTPNVAQEWTAGTLPLCWILGALVVLIVRAGRMLVPPGAWDDAAKQQNRQAFLHLWRWTLALTVVEGFVVYLGGLGAAP